MPTDGAAAFARLAAEVRHDLQDLDRLVAQAVEGAGRLGGPTPDTFVVYGVSKVVHDFYLATERLLSRVATPFGGLPNPGPGWHRQLLEGAVLDLPTLRPPLLSDRAARQLDEFLRFRHRFRTLYAFDIEAEPLQRLITKLPDAHAALRQDVERFLGFAARSGGGALTARSAGGDWFKSGLAVAERSGDEPRSGREARSGGGDPPSGSGAAGQLSATAGAHHCPRPPFWEVM
ncbi:MAG: hypothetical protein EXR72_16150 [Myxococcales bacterium]|nr:hypothetical protein [Myxococcales bacterium]